MAWARGERPQDYGKFLSNTDCSTFTRTVHIAKDTANSL
jgi:hypothetical protein